MRRVDVDSITFATGAWTVSQDQYPALASIAQVIQEMISANPREMFMIEGHTDKVGNEVDNLSLSDRRAEEVSNILSSEFQIPPENMVTQGYGEQFPKEETEGPSRINRRVTMRRITPLLTGERDVPSEPPDPGARDPRQPPRGDPGARDAREPPPGDPGEPPPGEEEPEPPARR
jgi:OmpA-OmpF porin, OOP family